MPKTLMEDTGIMNLLINGTFSTTVSGELFETSVYSCLRNNINIENIYYWRTNKGFYVTLDHAIKWDKQRIELVLSLEIPALLLISHLLPLITTVLASIARTIIYNNDLNLILCINLKIDSKQFLSKSLVFQFTIIIDKLIITLKPSAICRQLSVIIKIKYIIFLSFGCIQPLIGEKYGCV